MPDLALFDQVADSACDVLDRYVGIDAVLVKQVDGLDAEPFERAFDRRADMLGTAVHAAVRARVRIEIEAELGRDHDPVAEGAKRLPDHFLVFERAVHFGGVEEGHSAIDGGADELDPVILRKLGRVTKADAHAAKSDGRDFEAAAAEFTRLHVRAPSNEFGRRRLLRTPAERWSAQCSRSANPSRTRDGSRLR